MIMSHDALVSHRELIEKFALKLGMSEIAAALAFKNFLENVVKVDFDIEKFEDDFGKRAEKLNQFNELDLHTYELLLILMTQDKSFSLKYVERAASFFTETLGTSYEDFANHCFGSDRLVKTFIPENFNATEFEKMFAFFYCMYIHAKSDKKFNTSEVHFLRSFADYLGLELENSNLWIGFREYEDRHTESLLKALGTTEQKCAYMGILAVVMGGTKDFEPQERKLLQRYFGELKLQTEDLKFLRSKPEFPVSELLNYISVENFPFLLTAIIEAVFADGKIDQAESEVVARICQNKNSFMILPCHLLKLYFEVIRNAKSFKKEDAVYLSEICDLFSESVPDEGTRGQLFFLVETYFNLKLNVELSPLELESCLQLLKFSPESIPGIVENCRKNIKGTNSQIQTLAYVESIHCLKNNEFANSDSLILLLRKVLSTTVINKMKIMQLTLSFVISDNKLTLFDNGLIEDLSNELGLHREELKPLIFFMSLAGGERAGAKIRFRGE